MSTADAADTIVRSDPPCRVIARSKTKVEVFTVFERDDDASNTAASPPPKVLWQGATSWQQYAPDGSCLYLQTGRGVVKIDLTNSNNSSSNSGGDEPKAFLPNSTTIQMMHVSASGNFLLTWQRPKEDDTNNLKLWKASDGSLVASFPQKQLRRDSWPTLQWTHDEAYAFLLSTNEIRVYPKSNLLEPGNGRFTDKIRVQNIGIMSLPQTAKEGSPYYFTTFVPGTKDKPARGTFQEYIPGSSAEAPCLLSKSLFQAEEMTSHWSPQGDAALISLQTSIDHTGQSYYGSNQVFMMANFLTDTVAVEGVTPPVLAVEWMPHPDRPPTFCVVAGMMPALASLHHGLTGKPTFLFGQAHRNQVHWSPHGRFLLLSGFGNLAGGMSFWDKNKAKLISGCAANVSGQLRAEAVVGCKWSPDSRLVVTSTTTPRMNVDNGMRLFRYNGSEIKNVPWDNKQYHPDQLLEATFVPAKLSVYPDRPQSPNLAEQEKLDGPAALSSKQPAAAVKPVGRYVPPIARGRTGGGTSLAERMRREKEGSLQQATRVDAKKVVSTTTVKSALTGKAIAGLAADQGKSASAIKREKQKLKKQQEETQRKQRELIEQQAQQAEANEQQDPEKRARKINKTLKQIDDLKTKDPSTLNEDQQSKIASEASLREELKMLAI
jgi:translation initiation factor 2A